VLELDLNEQINGTANIDRLLMDARWPNLRVLRLRGVNCRVPELTHFLIAHASLEELALAQMMSGHAWTRLELPCDALPNLRLLECSSAQAAALLKNSEASNRPLETLLGIEVHDTVVDSRYFSWDDDWEDEDHEDADEEQPSPWKALFLDGLKAQHTITRLGVVSISAVRELETLSAVAPQVKDIEIGTERDFQLPVSLSCSYIYRQRQETALLITSNRQPNGTGCTPSSQHSRSSGVETSCGSTHLGT